MRREFDAVESVGPSLSSIVEPNLTITRPPSASASEPKYLNITPARCTFRALQRTHYAAPRVSGARVGADGAGHKILSRCCLSGVCFPFGSRGGGGREVC